MSEKKPPLTAQKPYLTRAAEKQKQIRFLVSQSFDTFNIYGKEPEAMANSLLSFNLALEDVDLSYIRQAFEFWLKENPQMPTPADIRSIALKFQVDEEKAKNSVSNSKAFMADPVEIPCVPWYKMTYEAATNAGLVQTIIDHLHFTLTPEKADDYRKYLHGFLGFPSNFGRVADL